MKKTEKFEVGYDKNPGIEKEIHDWAFKTIKKATVVHKQNMLIGI